MNTGRFVFPLVFVAILVGPFAFQPWVGRATAPATDSTLELHIITPHEQDIRRTFGAAFSAWHGEHYGQTVRVVYLTPQGTNDMIRYLRDAFGASGLHASAPKPAEDSVHLDIDLAWGGGDVTFDRELKPFLKAVKLAPGVLSNAFPERDLAGLPMYDAANPTPLWIGAALSSFGIVFNAELFRAMGLPAPTTWSDLANPALAGFIGMSDPTHSGSAAFAYMMVLQSAMADAERALQANAEREPATAEQKARALDEGFQTGLQTLTRIAANSRYFADTASRPCDDVGQGDSAAAVAIDFYARVLAEKVGDERVRYIAPRGATAITPDPIAVLYGTVGEREVLANRFIEFLLSPEGQRLWNLKRDASPFVQRSLRRLPIRRDVYADRTGWADDTNPFEDADGFNVRKEWLSLFRETRELWAAAWLDNHSYLSAAYDEVRAVPDPNLRDALLNELTALPITMSELASAKAQREELERASSGPNTDARLTTARVRLDWANRFRKHYEAVREHAAAARRP
jgi:iron(III) transport system substrate-binding protein